MSATPSIPTVPAAGAEPDPLIGRTINDRYKIVEAIGHGGMGRVYKALQSPLDRLVALKVLGAGHDRDPNFYKRFFLEASVTAKLTHPNTITLYDYGRTDDGIFFIAMEYLNGRTLSQTMQQEGPLAQERVVHISQQICRSLREAHALGIIHRDLKPANVMLLRQQDDHDFIKVLDFGLVKFFFGENPEGEITNAGTFMGSPHYIAPEQARNQGPDQRCDIYSLGVLMYHMLTGRVPFTAPNPVDIILKHLHEAPVPPREAGPDLNIDAQLQTIVLRCLAKERDGRFQSMDEMLAQLKVVRHQLTGHSGPRSTPVPLAEDPMRPAHTPPSPQPAVRTPSGPMTAVEVAHVSRPPPPPDDEDPGEPRIPQFARLLQRAPPLPLRLARLLQHALASRFARQLRRVPPMQFALPVAAAVALVAVGLALRNRGEPQAVAPIAQATPAPATPAPQPAEAAAPPPAPVYQTAVSNVTTVTVTSTPSGAGVTDIDGRALGTTPLDLPVTTGKPLQLILMHDGYKPFTLSRKTVEGERVSLSAMLKKTEEKPQPAKRSVGYKDDPY